MSYKHDQRWASAPKTALAGALGYQEKVLANPVVLIENWDRGGAVKRRGKTKNYETGAILCFAADEFSIVFVWTESVSEW